MATRASGFLAKVLVITAAGAGLTACASDPLKEDVAAYDKAAKALLERLNGAREDLSSAARRTRGGTEADFKDAAAAVRATALAKLDAVIKEADGLAVKTPEVQALNRKLVAALRLEREYVAGTAEALDAGDQAAMGAAKRKSQAAAQAIEEWETELKNLGGRHGLRL